MSARARLGWMPWAAAISALVKPAGMHDEHRSLARVDAGQLVDDLGDQDSLGRVGVGAAGGEDAVRSVVDGGDATVAPVQADRLADRDLGEPAEVGLAPRVLGDELKPGERARVLDVGDAGVDVCPDDPSQAVGVGDVQALLVAARARGLTNRIAGAVGGVGAGHGQPRARRPSRATRRIPSGTAKRRVSARLAPRAVRGASLRDRASARTSPPWCPDHVRSTIAVQPCPPTPSLASWPVRRRAINEWSLLDSQAGV